MTWKKTLKLKCKKNCSDCCKGFEGYVWLDKKNIEEIANFLKITTKEFLKKYTRSVFGRISLIEIKNNFECIFLKDSKCSIYSVRPKQCSTYPFWKQNISSKKAWEDVKNDCP